jgi:hypothetical protein
MIFGVPLAIWFWILTISSVFTTASLGIAMHMFRKNVFKYHRFFAFLSLSLAVIHATLAILLWSFGIII